MKTYFTSESVCKGHPDKVCDLISDAILDEALKKNPYCHNAVETTVKDNIVFIYGETDTPVDYASIAKYVIKEIGYDYVPQIIVQVSNQSPQINSAVNKDDEVGAGDQGIIFGYACKETEQFMPLSIMLAHDIAKRLDNIDYPGLLPDGKTQVTVSYEDGKLNKIETVLVSKQHTESTSKDILEAIILSAISDSISEMGFVDYIDEDTKYIINPSGMFTIGGPEGDSGTTGRKIVVDTYGGHGRVGGGCFSSKDPTKVDRSAAYYARYVAKNIVAAGYADKCEVQVSYGIGITKPLSVFVECFGTNTVPMDYIVYYVNRNFNFSPSNIIKELDLRKPIYKDTACYGHFGNEDYPWEKIKLV